MYATIPCLKTFNWIAVSVAQCSSSFSSFLVFIIINILWFSHGIIECACCNILHIFKSNEMSEFKIKIFEIHNDLLIIRKILEWFECVWGCCCCCCCFWCRCCFLFIALQHFDAKIYIAFNANGMFCHWSCNYHWIRIHRHRHRRCAVLPLFLSSFELL